jgi:16S rRNA (cytosine1402-N4)-methyltransferase
MARDYHRPVLLKETIDLLNPRPGGIFIDATVGGGGHAKAILEKIVPDGRLLAIDQDEEALEEARKVLSEFAERVTFAQANFAQLEEVAQRSGFDGADGVLFDLGVSSHQLEAAERGFSFREDAFLDMRMDKSQPTRAYDVVNRTAERELAELIRSNSDERFARRIARAIVKEREKHPIETTRQLADIVTSAIPAPARPKDIHPATRTFLALRVSVNREYEVLDAGLTGALNVLAGGGRLAAISYHSLEDGRVKSFFRSQSGKCECPPGLPVCVCGAEKRLRVVTKKPVTPEEDEVRENPRARSAKLRAAEKIA